jgi:proteasome accessory factor B
VIEEEVDGGLVLTIRLRALPEVERWVLSWGAHVEVLTPVELRRRVAEVARAILARSEGA